MLLACPKGYSQLVHPLVTFDSNPFFCQQEQPAVQQTTRPRRPIHVVRWLSVLSAGGVRHVLRVFLIPGIFRSHISEKPKTLIYVLVF